MAGHLDGLGRGGRGIPLAQGRQVGIAGQRSQESGFQSDGLVPTAAPCRWACS